MMAHQSIDEWALHAYADGELTEESRAIVEDWLASHPDDVRRVAAWKRQKAALAAAYSGVADDEVPVGLKAAARRAPAYGARPLLRRSAIAAAMIVALGLSALAGWYSATVFQNDRRLATRLQDEALSAHTVFTPEVRHPVEVGASEKDHLVAWLSKRLSHPLKMPDLTTFGFELVGGRLLAEAGLPAAQFMFQNDQGRRLTLYIARNPANRETAFRIDRHGALTTCYWFDAGLGYALAAEISHDEMLPIARAVYDQIAG
jgi:anti-sigma factor RsiW